MPYTISSRVESAEGSIFNELFKRQAQLSNPVDMSIGLPEGDTPQSIARAGIRAIEDGHTKYISPKGLQKLRVGLAAKLSRNNGLAVDENLVTIVPGSSQTTLLWARLSIFFAAPMSYLFYLLSKTMPSENMVISGRKLVLGLVIVLATMLVAVSPYAFTGVETGPDGVRPSTGPGMAVFSVVSTYFTVASIIESFKKYKTTKGVERSQNGLVLLGIAAMLGLVIFTVLLPLLIFGSSFFVAFMPLYTMIFLGLTSMAIIRYKLFDIRSVIARSVSYLTLIMILALVLSLVVTFSTPLISDAPRNTAQQALFVVSSILVAAAFQPMRRFVETMTDKYFFKRAYEPQVFINEFNKSLVSSINLEELAINSTDIIKANLKPLFCTLLVSVDDKQKSAKLFGSVDGGPTLEQAVGIWQGVSGRTGSTIISLDNDTETDDVPLVKDMKNSDTSLAVKLESTMHGFHESIGCLLVGGKRNGDAYNQQDFRVIGIIVNELVLAVENSLKYDEIERFNLTLQNKVDAATRKLKKANIHLKELDQTKDDFISMTSHQLKPKLTAALGFVEMLNEGKEGSLNSGQKSLVELTLKSVGRMVEIVSDLLDTSKMSAGKLELNLQTGSLKTLARQEVDRLQERASERSISIQLDSPGRFPSSEFDQLKIKEVISNLISNAIQYSHENSVIVVSLNRKRELLEFSVKDAGIGIPLQAQPKLFAKFFRADNAVLVRPTGTGVGLYFVKRVIESHGGKMSFSSKQGEGSKFGFVLPVSPKS